MSGEGSPLEIAQAWMAAAARCDVAAVEQSMAENCLRYGEPEWIVVGKAPYIAAYRQFLQSFSNYRLEVLNSLARDRTVVFEMIESARFTAPYRLSDGTLVQPNGKSYTDRCCTWLEIDGDGKVSEIRAYIPTTRGRLIAEAMATRPESA